MTPQTTMTPEQYAKSLRYSAESSDRSAARWRNPNERPFKGGCEQIAEMEARHFDRQSRRLRAMALLCDRSTAATTRGVDFFDLHNPAMSLERELYIVERIERGELP